MRYIVIVCLCRPTRKKKKRIISSLRREKKNTFRCALLLFHFFFILANIFEPSVFRQSAIQRRTRFCYIFFHFSCSRRNLHCFCLFLFFLCAASAIHNIFFVSFSVLWLSLWVFFVLFSQCVEIWSLFFDKISKWNEELSVAVFCLSCQKCCQKTLTKKREISLSKFFNPRRKFFFSNSLLLNLSFFFG